MQMQKSDIHEYARSLYEAHGDKALADAAQKAKNFEAKGQHEEAKTWRRIESTLQEIRGPRQT